MQELYMTRIRKSAQHAVLFPGLLQTAFIICYFLSAPLFGYLGDRYSRKWLMVLGMLAWSTCTLIATFMPV